MFQGTGKEEHKKIIDFILSKLEEWSNTIKRNNI